MRGAEPIVDPAALHPELRELLTSLFPDDGMRRRALLAPWCWGGNCYSVWQARDCWVQTDRPSRSIRAVLESELSHKRDYFAPEQPFFPAAGTGGSLRSPFPSLSDAEYWMFLMLYQQGGSGYGTDHQLSERLFLFEGSDAETAVAFLQRRRREGEKHRPLYSPNDPAPLWTVWDVLTQELSLWPRAPDSAPPDVASPDHVPGGEKLAPVEGLPPALGSLLAAHFPDEQVQQRALVAPWCLDEGRHSIGEMRALWQRDDRRARILRGELTRCLARDSRLLSLDEPFFPADGTGGALRSPYEVLTDSEYWMFHVMFASREQVVEALERRQYHALGRRAVIDYLRRIRSAGRWSLLARRLGLCKQKDDPVCRAWRAVYDDVHFDPHAQ